MPSIIGQLRVVLGADTAQFGRAMKEAQGGLADFTTRVKMATAEVAGRFAVVAAAATAMASAVAYAMNGSMEEFRKVGEASKQLDIPVEKLSALKFAAEASGASFDTLSSALGTLGGKISESVTGPANEATYAFRGLGIAVRDAEGELRPTTDVLGDIAAKFATYEDGAAKTALATKLFGEAGRELIPFLNRGRDGIAELEAQAKRLGATFGKDVTEAANRYRDSLNNIHAAKNALWTQVATKLAPVMEHIANRFQMATKDAKALELGGSLLANTLREIVAAGEIVTAVFRGISSVITTVTQAINFILQREFGKAWETLKAGAVDLKTIYSDTRREIVMLYSDWMTTVKKSGAEGAKGLAPWTKGADELKASLEAAKAELMALIASAGADVYEKQAAIDQALKDKLISNAEAIKLSAQVTAQAMRVVRDEARAAYEAVLAVPTASFEEKMAALRKAYDDGTVGLREFGRLERELNKEHRQHWNDMASAVSSALTTIFGKSKAAAYASTVINTAQAIMRNHAAYPEPFGSIMAAIAAATGAAQLAAIRKQNLSGSGGGSPSAGGGSGAASAAVAAPLPQQILTVQGLDRNSLMTGDMVAALAQKLLAYQKDGGVVLFDEG